MMSWQMKLQVNTKGEMALYCGTGLILMNLVHKIKHITDLGGKLTAVGDSL